MKSILWLAFSPDGRHLAYGSERGVGVLKVPSLETVWERNLLGRVDWVEWASDSRHLITHNGNKTIYVLRLNQLASEANREIPLQPSGSQ